jgi:cytochrome c oxidase subunit 2
MLPPQTSDARIIKDLYDLVFWMAVFTFILVEALLIYVAVKFRRKSNDELPYQTHGNTWAELTWTVIPALVVAIIFFASINASSRLTGRGTQANPVAMVHAASDSKAALRIQEAADPDLVIEVTGFQWFWQYTYKYNDAELTTDSNNNAPLLLPANKLIRLDLQAQDVIHAWYVPQFGPMIYVNPNEKSYVFIDKPQEGVYKGQCNFYCGKDHAFMQSKVAVMPSDQFDEWYKTETVGKPLRPGEPDKGREAFLNGPCIACHYIEGTKAQGKVAPRDMTKFATYTTIAQVSGFDNTPENLKKWLKNPQEIKPGTAMPNLNLNPQKIEDLVAYLSSLK